MGSSVNPLSVVMTPFQIAAGAWENERNIEVQKNNNRINREWQSKENALDREFQVQQQNNLLSSQQGFQKEMFDLQNQYNLPSHQLARLRSAGVNPAALLASGSSGIPSLSGSSSGVPSIPSVPPSIGSHSVTPSPQIQTPMSSIAQMFSSIAQLQDAVSNAERQGAESKRVKALLPKEADKLEAETGVMISQARLNEATTAVTEFNNMLQKMFGKDEKAAQVSKLMNESYALFAKGQLDEAQSVYTQGLNMLNELEYKIKDAQYPQLIQQATLYNELLKAQKDTENAKQSEAYASAEQHRTQADVNRSISALNVIEKEIKKNDKSVSDATILDRIDQIRYSSGLTDAQWQKISGEIEQIKLDLKLSPVERVSKIVRTVVNLLDGLQ